MSELNYIIEFIKPELILLVPVCYLIGIGIKKTETIKDKLIPMILGIVSILLAIVYIVATSTFENYQSVMMGTFVGITQGILCAGCSVYVDQLIKQNKKEE